MIDPARTVRVSRVIPATPETVFRTWTDPKLVPRWHGSRAGRILGFQRDLVEGGTFKLRMEVAGGKVYHVFGTYREVDFPRRLVYTWDLEEAEDWVGETLVTVEFLPEGEATRVVITHEGFPAAEDTEGPRGGWAGCLENLELLSRRPMNESEGSGTLGERGGRYRLRFERFLGHSRERVWRAITSEDDLSAWFPARMEGEREVGAALRFVFPEPGQTPADSDEEGLVMTGEILVWDPPGVLEYRWDGDVLRWELEERPGGTLLTFTHTFDDQGRAAWDAAGWDHCFASLEACLGGSPVEPFTWERHNDRLARYARRFGPEGAVQRRPTPLDELAFASLESTEDT